ncbi:GNAT family N-acetyltransferase [Pseudonocardia petroleophila]|uniref:GNAT family N-acetyltransferase n=1 Tax=Pseudonocardia petroleophila TaxID=37331 RepID=A0A7G7MNZ4_9PSEU|nr:GNAT family N-acetyltransferase [Pseudonocardia petroleophila]
MRRVTIRPLGSGDRDAVVALSLRAWEPVFASLRSVLHGSGVFDLQYPRGWAAAQAAAVGEVCDSGRVWVADVDGVVAGFVAVVLHTDDLMGEIHMVAVDPAFQRRGLGAGLTGFALGWMAEQGMTTAMVETGGDPGHAPARATYEAAGFTHLPISRYFRTL